MKAVALIAGNTFLEAVRQKFFNFLLLLGLALTLVSVGLSGLNFGGTELKFVADFGFGGLFLFGSVLAVVMSVQLFFAEIDNRTAITLLAKPVSRASFVLGKFFGVWLLLGVFTLILAALLGLVLALRQPALAAQAAARGMPEPFLSLGGLAVFALVQWARLGVVAAMTMAFTSFSQTYLYAVVVSFCGLLIAQLQYVLQDVAVSEKSSEAAKLGAAALAKVVPNLQLFNVGPQLTLERAGLPAETLWEIFGYGAVWIAAPLVVTLWFFRSREM
ncbi:MAG: ABC transporter permease subunit [Candidatus Spyradosoma sp.]